MRTKQLAANENNPALPEEVYWVIAIFVGMMTLADSHAELPLLLASVFINMAAALFCTQLAIHAYTEIRMNRWRRPY